MLATAVVLAALKLDWFVSFAVVCVLSVVLSLVWHVCRPILEENR
jgi:membrane protein implicated in regulation of membrane protease activity